MQPCVRGSSLSVVLSRCSEANWSDINIMSLREVWISAFMIFRQSRNCMKRWQSPSRSVCLFKMTNILMKYKSMDMDSIEWTKLLLEVSSQLIDSVDSMSVLMAVKCSLILDQQGDQTDRVQTYIHTKKHTYKQTLIQRHT